MPLFKKKKLVVSEPSLVRPNTRFEVLQGGWASMPTPSQWQSASSGGAGKLARQPFLDLIDKYVVAYHKEREWWAKLSVLGQLYFLTNQWLKWAEKNQNVISTARQPAVNDLFRITVQSLCAKLSCHFNVLPEMIERYWGRALTPHGAAEDNRKPYTNNRLPRGASPQITTYLSRAEAEKYHLTFSDGKVYQVPFWRADGPFDLVLAESSQVGWEWGAPLAEDMMEPGFAGFALSMNREFYMARHHGNDFIGNFFHSCYLAGDATLCTGSMLIRNGRVLAVKNDSGHYRPTIAHLVNVVQALEMYGVPPRHLQVIAMAGSWFDQNGDPGPCDYTTTGDKLLRLGTVGWDLQEREFSNADNMTKRGWRPAPRPTR